MGLLTTLIWLPVIGGILLLVIGERDSRLDRWLALAISLLTFVLSISLYTGFDFSTPAMQFVEQMPWVPAFNIE